MTLVIKLPPRLKITLRDEREHLYKRWKCLVPRLASKFSTRWKVPFEELYDEGCHALALEICSRWHVWDPEKSSEQTWLYQSIYWHLLTHCETSKKTLQGLTTHHHSKTDWMAALRQEVSDEGLVLINMICDPPEELEDIFWKPAPPDKPHIGPRLRRSARTTLVAALKHHLSEVHEWDRDKIDRVWTEVEEAVV